MEFWKLWAVVRKDKYDRLVAELQDVLLQGWDEATRQAVAEVIRGLVGTAPYSDADLQQMLQQLRVRLGIKFANDVAAPLFEIQMDTYVQGMKDILSVKPTFQMIDQQALDALQRHNIYWVRNFWDAQLGEQVAELGRQIIEAGLNREQAGKLFEEAFSRRFETYSWRYWQGFANHVVTRSRELGRVEGYVRAGIKYLEVRAVLDRRTTRICREMHGRIIPVEEAVALRDALIAAKDPEEVTRIAPWRKPEEIEGKPTSRLPKGMALPPYHFNCRTRTIMARKAKAIKDIDFAAAGAATELREALRQIVNNQEQLSGKELVQLVERAMGATWKVKKWTYQNRKVDNPTYHFLRHKAEKYTGWKSLTEMNDMILDLIRGPGRDIYLQMLSDKTPTIVFHNGRVMVSIDLQRNQILTIFSLRKNIEKQLQRRNSKFVKQKKGRSIKKWWQKMEKVSDKDSFEVAWDAWIHHYQDLLILGNKEADEIILKTRLLVARSEIEDYLQAHPNALSEKEKKALAQSDQWLLDHANEPVIQEFLRNFTDEPSMKYWWEDIGTLIKEKEKRQKKKE